MSIKIGIIGSGYMGEAHARVINRISKENPEELELSLIIDKDVSRAKKVARRYGGRYLDDVKKILEGDIDFAIISTPTSIHLSVFLMLAEKGVRGFLIEKPMVASFSEAQKILEYVNEYNIWVTLGHTERFNPALQAVNKKILSGKIGNPLTYMARRVGPFTPRVKDVDVILDLGIHEIDHALLLYNSIPEEIRAYTLRSLVSETNDYALIILGYEKGFANIEVNRITPYKQRMVYITGDKGAIYLDYMRQEAKLYVGDEETSLVVKREEPLYLQDIIALKLFIEKRDPLVDAYQGALGIFICEKAIQSAFSGQPLRVFEHEDYLSNEELFSKSLSGFRYYRDYLLSREVYWWG